MAESQFKSTLANIVKSININKTVLDEVKCDNIIIMEQLNTIYQRVEDMSKKFDEVLNTGIKKPLTSAPKKAVAREPKAKTPKPANLKQPVDVTMPHKKSSVKIKASDAKAEEAEEPVKVIKNIMTFFKTRYIEDPTIFDDILEENQAESVFLAAESDLITKKEGNVRDKAKATLLYKNMNKDQKKKIREKMLSEHDAANANNDEDVDEETGDD
jgi:hypothetical protein